MHCITNKESSHISAEERILLLALYTVEIWQRKRPESFFEALTGLWLRKYIKIITKQFNIFVVSEQKKKQFTNR
jgi:hypothetical protein